MFVLCPHCQFLVTIDPISGQPPSLCPRCAEPMLADNASAALPAADDADTATDTAMDAGGREPTERLVEPLVVTATEPAVALPSDRVPMPPAQEDASAQTTGAQSRRAEDAIATEHAQGDDSTTSRGDASGEPASDEHAIDKPERDSPAIEATDTLIEAMLGPASVEIEAAMDDPPTDPDDPVPDLSVDVPAQAAPEPGPAEEPETSTPVADPTPEPLPGAPDPADATPAPESPPAAPAPAKPAPSFVRRPAAVSGVTPRRHRLKAAAISGLALVLVLQLVLADRAQLAANPRWRPAMTALCSVLHCTLPPWHEPAAFTLLQRDVRPHPTIDGALQITATFRNDARWAQPLPGLLLTLSDIDGRVVAARTFTPKDYLGGMRRKTPTQTQTTLASGHSATIAMDVVDPTPRIVAFTFDFQ